ncbi:bifunctional 2-polyprenyl-6-hydroxyphenol methylase/3-demethylubiquinol 3-O-methyltransferase UbiG [Pseudomaricurvus sp. HS19]|uniref:class I SAM-dependent methyltransferase n=1 Tax=Pseudomaricurvus sp. HS19 TaxID=2692626 RepID=UPI001371570E|nr:class I SAM-dependent methyltransferase [Pseudomaricurvus sp. HS19]MYM64710.1 methyltransferase domain-containing protein [Pseudomaricurvus sp. HS19]
MKYIYTLNSFDIIQCVGCCSSTVSVPPSEDEIEKYYDGFMFNARPSRKKFIFNSKIEGWLKNMGLPANAAMLDIGGGGGFFSHAFESFGLGRAFYVDLDAKACEFARNELSLDRVYNTKVEDISSLPNNKFDFVFCRHVIEHLTRPDELILQAIDAMADRGVFHLQCPNGISLERLGYYSYARKRVKALRKGNPNFSGLSAWALMLGKKIPYGINPINHLWSITEEGLNAFLAGIDGIQYEVFTAPLNDAVYSPWLASGGVKKTAHSWLMASTLGKIRGGAHLIATIKKLDGSV